MAAVWRFFYESLTLNLAGTFFTGRKSRGGRCTEVTVIRGSTVLPLVYFAFMKFTGFSVLKFTKMAGSPQKTTQFYHRAPISYLLRRCMRIKVFQQGLHQENVNKSVVMYRFVNT